MSERIYQGSNKTNTKVVELWVRKYPSDLPYFIRVNGRMIAEADDMCSAYALYNEAFKD